MGFPNVDVFLVKTFLSSLRSLQTSPAGTIADLFEDLDADDRASIIQYVKSLTITGDVRERDERNKYLYVLPHFPLLGYPFPQIGISLGQEDTANKFIGDYTGEPVAVIDSNGATIGYDQEKGYLASGTWNIDVVCATKPESIWLSRMCQLFICQRLEELTALGVMEVNIALADLKLEAQQTMQPGEIFNRGIRVTARVANTWKKRLPPPNAYAVGKNTAK